MQPAPDYALWRVGYAPDPLAWSGWRHAVDHRFGGRWDDSEGEFRTLYLGDSLYACLLEVLAFARKDTDVAEELSEIDEDPEDAAQYPTAEPGELDPAWLGPRLAASAVLSGHYCQVTHSDTISALRPAFITEAVDAGHADFDASLLKNAGPGGRKITQRVASYIFSQGTDGIAFTSRHGDELKLWCVFEQLGEAQVSRNLTKISEDRLTEKTPELLRAFETHKLSWAH